MTKTLDILFCVGILIGTLTVGGAIAFMLEIVLRLI